MSLKELNINTLIEEICDAMYHNIGKTNLRPEVEEFLKFWNEARKQHLSAKHKEWDKHLIDAQRFYLLLGIKRGFNDCILYTKPGEQPNCFKFEQATGLNYYDLVDYLEDQFEPGMNWGNYPKVWHWDRKVPIACLGNPPPGSDEYNWVFSKENNQPLFLAENIIKKDYIPSDFYYIRSKQEFDHFLVHNTRDQRHRIILAKKLLKKYCRKRDLLCIPDGNPLEIPEIKELLKKSEIFWKKIKFEASTTLIKNKKNYAVFDDYNYPLFNKKQLKN